MCLLIHIRIQVNQCYQKALPELAESITVLTGPKNKHWLNNIEIDNAIKQVNVLKPLQNDYNFADDVSITFPGVKLFYFDSNLPRFVPKCSVDNKHTE